MRGRDLAGILVSDLVRLGGCDREERTWRPEGKGTLCFADQCVSAGSALGPSSSGVSSAALGACAWGCFGGKENTN